MLKKINYIVLFVFIIVSTNLKADVPYKGQGELDLFSLTLKNASREGMYPQVYIGMDNSKVSNCDYVQGDAAKMTTGKAAYNYWIVADDNGDPLVLKYKPYSNFYVDFKLEIHITIDNPGTFTFSISPEEVMEQKAMKVIQLVDKEKPEAEWVNLLKNEYSVTLQKGSYADRFVVRVYGADIPKISSAPLDWNTASTWQSGYIPQSNSHVHILQGSNVVTKSSDNISVELLSSLGYLENNGTLTSQNVEFY